MFLSFLSKAQYTCFKRDGDVVFASPGALPLANRYVRGFAYLCPVCLLSFPIIVVLVERSMGSDCLSLVGKFGLAGIVDRDEAQARIRASKSGC
jgi:hypothetical protein